MSRKFALGEALWLTIFLLVGVHLAEAQQPVKIYRIGFLDNSTASGMAVLVKAFRQELNTIGWIEGKNIAIEYRYAEGKVEHLPVAGIGAGPP